MANDGKSEGSGFKINQQLRISKITNIVPPNHRETNI